MANRTIRLFGLVDCGECGTPAAVYNPVTGVTVHVSQWKQPCITKLPAPEEKTRG